MKYFIDTEFIEGFHKPMFGKRRHFIDLISIGIIAEDGREYYAISKEYNYKDASDWVKENIITQIYREQIPAFKQQFINLKTFHKYIPDGKTNKQIAEEIKEFCKPQRTFEIEKPITIKYSEVQNPEFYGYYSDYDWVLFCSLFGTMMDLPKGFPMYCIDLMQTLDETAISLTSAELSKLSYPTVTHNVYSTLDTGVINDRVKCLQSAVDYPKQKNEHNALADAKWNKDLFSFLKSVGKK
jgi:hypothetical protein